MSRSPARPRLALPRLGAALAPQVADRGDRGAPPAHRRAPRGDAGRLAQAARRSAAAHAADQPGLGQRLPRRGARPGFGHRQRIHAAAASIARRPGRAAFSGRARRRGSAGAPARRSGSSSPSPTARSSRCSATAPTSSRTRSRCTTPRRCTGCRCCSSSSTTRCGARCAAPPSACTRKGEAARSNQPPFIDLDELPAFEQVCAAAGGYGERVEDPAELPGRWSAR